MDGDTLLEADVLARSCAVLPTQPRVGAVTTDNILLVEGSTFTREWYRVRMAHRDSFMASIALARKLLVLTGRFSVFRAELATGNRFIRAIERDYVEHGRLGRIPMLTGGDKSTWLETLRSGWDMSYLPDVVVYPVVELPSGGFAKANTALMLRWYGNTVRNNGRALSLGPKRCGPFLWLSLLGQRFSMWTALVGPSTAIVLALTRHGSVLTTYLLRVLVSRGIVCLFYWIVTGRFHPLFIVTLYCKQVIGAAIKIFAFYHPDRQKWTRQQAKAGGAPPRSFAAALSMPLMMATAACFVLTAVLLTGATEFTAQRRNMPPAWWVPSWRRPALHRSSMHPASERRSVPALPRISACRSPSRPIPRLAGSWQPRWWPRSA